MRRRGWLLAAVCLAGCGSASEPPAGLALPDLGATCAGVQRAQELPVLCAPAADDPAYALVHDDLDEAPCQYLMNLEGRERGKGEHRHVLLSGRCGEAPLRADAAGRWDVDPPESLRLAGAPPYRSNGQPSPSRPRVVRRVEIRGNPGLLLRADPFPDGGAQGGHDALVWMEGGATYAVSVHRPVTVEELTRLAERLRPA